MCIRDRYFTGAIPHAHEQMPAKANDFENTVIVVFVLGLCCLLYTSDAADERSSVDLGGRRIIKKKNITDSGIGIDLSYDKHDNISQHI